MSLDVTLTMKGAPRKGTGILVRENGKTQEISQEEWDEKFPGREPILPRFDSDGGEVYSDNITHNLAQMAREAGVYEACWRPEEIGITRAHQLIEPLSKGLILLNSDPSKFRTFNPRNGWGSYEGLVKFVDGYLAACERFPDAEVEASR